MLSSRHPNHGVAPNRHVVSCTASNRSTLARCIRHTTRRTEQVRPTDLSSVLDGSRTPYPQLDDALPCSTSLPASRRRCVARRRHTAGRGRRALSRRVFRTSTAKRSVCRRAAERCSGGDSPPECGALAPPQVSTCVVIPHDDLFHFAFQHARHMAHWLQCVLPAAMTSAIDWGSLRPAPEKLRGQPLRLSIADLVFRAEQKHDRGPSWFVIEHKADDATDVEAQVLRYAVHLGDHVRASSARAPVVGIVCRHGERPLAPAAPSAVDPFAAYQPRMLLVVDDLARRTEEELRARPLTPLGTLAQLCLAFLPDRTGDECLQFLERHGDLLRAVDRDDTPPIGRDAVAKIGWYALTVVDVAPRDLHDTFERLLQRPEDTIMGTLERTYQKGRTEGKAEGKTEGRADTILRMVTKRFGPLPEDVVDRIRRGTEADLDRWTDRILDARTLAEVFAG